MRRKSLKNATCPVARSLEAIGDWWSLLIVRDAFDGMRRFGEFQKSLGIAKNILTVRLRGLVRDGILKPEPASDGSRHQEYVLTAKGSGLFPVVVGLRQWGEDHFYSAREAHSRLVDRRQKRAVRRLEVRSKDGRVLSPSDTVVKRAD